jgi:esterase/lipase superfamily enzyme
MNPSTSAHLLAVAVSLSLTVGCAGGPRQLMPTPLLYQGQDSAMLFRPAAVEAAVAPVPPTPAIDLLFITDRGPPTAAEIELGLPYGESRGRRIAFGSTEVRMEPDLTWEVLKTQSMLAERTRPVALVLGEVTEVGAFPQQPYAIQRLPDGHIIRDPAVLAAHRRANDALRAEIRRRLAASTTKDVVLYVHGFNETFESAAFTLAELCHFLGREPVCAFFTWPASHTGNFLISYTNTTESASYSLEHLKKTLRLIATMPEVGRLHVLAHSRGTALALDALQHLVIETIAAGDEPVAVLKLGEVGLLSPDIDVDIAAQRMTGYISDPDLISVWPEERLPRALHGHLTIYASPKDRALRVSRILFRSRNRLGQLTVADMTPEAQAFLGTTGRIHLITYEGKRTDFFGHSYFTSNPEVSSDLIAMLRYGKRLGEPGRELIPTGPVTWEFPTAGTRAPITN